MKILLAIVGVLVALVLILGGVSCSAYNGLVRSSQNVDQSWAQVQNVYQRRADLVPQLVGAVQGSANFEKSTLESVVQARASASQVTVNSPAAPTDPADLQKFEAAQNSLTQSLGRLLVTVERYPDLKSSGGFQTLQSQLEGTENRIATERGNFNGAVQAYNTKVKSFPSVIFAGMFNFKEKPYFAATTPGADVAPKVNFDFGSKATTR